MVERLLKDGHEVVVYDRSEDAINNIAGKSAIASNSLKELISKLPERKIGGLMVPSGKPVNENINELQNILNAKDIIIDGGNSFWKDTQARAERLNEKKFIVSITE